jgi:hypothetical protein
MASDRLSLEQSIYALCRVVTGGREHPDPIQCLANIGAEMQGLEAKIKAALAVGDNMARCLEAYAPNCDELQEWDALGGDDE